MHLDSRQVSRSTAGRIGEQHDAYRRGLVLGLTLAEVGLLIIFVLLLLIAFEAMRHIKDRKLFEGKEPVEISELVELRHSHDVLTQSAQELGLDATTPQDDFLELINTIQPLFRTGPGADLLAEARASIAERREVTTRLREDLSSIMAGDSESAADLLETQREKIANQEGQLAYLERHFSRIGYGTGARPCWVRPDGTIDYLFDVVLGANGIRMREYQYEARVAERSRLPAVIVKPDEVLSEREFLRRTEPLYQSSVADNCRFFVWIYDDTGPQEKALYKRLRRTVEGHFYINRHREDEPAPF